MTAHTCTTLTKGCYRCDLNRDEMPPLRHIAQDTLECTEHEIPALQADEVFDVVKAGILEEFRWQMSGAEMIDPKGQRRVFANPVELGNFISWLEAL